MQVTPINYNNRTSFGHGSHSDAPKSLKRKVFLTSLAAVGIATAVISKKQGFSLSPKKIFETHPKDWAIFKYRNPKKPNEKYIKYETWEILGLGASSVAGGLLGGIAFDDKKNAKAKLKESLNQLVGNIAVPIGAMGLVSHFYSDEDHFKKIGKPRPKDLVEKAMPQFKSTNKLVKGINSFIRGVPTIAITGVTLGAGIVIGNKVSNFINEKIYKRKVERDIKVSDFAPHIDDVCYAASMMAPKVPLFSAIARVVPLALVIPGAETGDAQQHPHGKAHKQ